MTLTQLEAFITAARLGTFSAAAESLRMSQPAVSDLIRRLESELGTKLFQRGARSLIVTAAGDQLVPFAEQSVNSAKQGAQAVKSLLALGGGTATFGLLRNSDFYLKTDLAKRFRFLYPDVRMRLIGQNSAETAGDVTAGILEAGLVTLPIDATDLEVFPLARDEVVYVSADPSRTREPRTIDDVCAAALVLYDAHYAATDPARRQLNERAQLNGSSLEPVIEVEFLTSALSLVQEGFGDTIACRASIASEVEPRGLSWVSFDEPMYDTLALVKKRGQMLSPATMELARLALASLVSHQNSPEGTAELIQGAEHGAGFFSAKS